MYFVGIPIIKHIIRLQ